MIWEYSVFSVKRKTKSVICLIHTHDIRIRGMKWQVKKKSLFLYKYPSLNQYRFKIWLSDMMKPLKRSGSVFFHLLKTLETRPEARRECGPRSVAGPLRAPGFISPCKGPWGVFHAVLAAHSHKPLCGLFQHPRRIGAFVDDTAGGAGRGERSLRGQGGVGSPLHVPGPLGVCSTYLLNVFTVFLQRQFGFVEMFTILNVLYCFWEGRGENWCNTNNGRSGIHFYSPRRNNNNIMSSVWESVGEEQKAKLK